MSERGQAILLVDDEPLIGQIMSRWLKDEGYFPEVAYNGAEALQALQARPFALVISDINMPVMTGIELLERIKQQYADVAVIMVTAVDDRKTALRMLQMGAYGYIIKPFDHNEVLINVANALERRSLVLAQQRYEQQLEEDVRARTAQIRKAQEEIAYRLVSASEFRDNETGAHIRRIGNYSAVLAEGLGWSKEQVDDIRLAAAMHDIGKIGVPDRILLKPGKLTPEEFTIMKSHTEIGARMLAHSHVPLLELAEEIARFHHEKWDGTGYPFGLRGDAIPLSARIVAVADVYDALIHERVYKPAFSEAETVEIMKTLQDKHFDPKVFRGFLRATAEFNQIRQQHLESEHQPLITWSETVGLGRAPPQSPPLTTP